jgi:hypothetical protein
MRIVLLVMLVVALVGAGAALAQYYPGYVYKPSTAGESYARGFADVVRSAGQANLDNSEAAINYSEARKREIENQRLWTDTYFQMRKMNREYREAERGPRPTMEDAVRYAQAGKPKRLSPSELDAVTGGVSWPILLRDDRYSQGRAELERLFAQRAASGTIGAQDYLKIRETTDAMLEQLKGQVRDVPPSDYVAARRFLESLAYESRLPTE